MMLTVLMMLTPLPGAWRGGDPWLVFSEPDGAVELPPHHPLRHGPAVPPAGHGDIPPQGGHPRPPGHLSDWLSTSTRIILKMIIRLRVSKQRRSTTLRMTTRTRKKRRKRRRMRRTGRGELGWTHWRWGVRPSCDQSLYICPGDHWWVRGFVLIRRFFQHKQIL